MSVPIFLVVVGLVAFVLTRGAEPTAARAADPACLGAWNDDPEALEFGRHQLGFHGYTQVQVLRVSEQGAPVDSGAGGLCAVAFAGVMLDSEPGAAARVQEGGMWQALESLPAVTPTQLLQMQTDAQKAPNAQLEEDGRLMAL